MENAEKMVERINWETLPLIMTPADIARIWPGGKNSAYALFHRRDFPGIRHGKRLFVARDAFKQWLEKALVAES